MAATKGKRTEIQYYQPRLALTSYPRDNNAPGWTRTSDPLLSLPLQISLAPPSGCGLDHILGISARVRMASTVSPRYYDRGVTSVLSWRLGAPLEFHRYSTLHRTDYLFSARAPTLKADALSD